MINLLVYLLCSFLTQGLDSEEFAARKGCHAVLKFLIMNEVGVRCLARMAEKPSSLEAKARLASLFDDYYNVTPASRQEMPRLDRIRHVFERKAAAKRYLETNSDYRYSDSFMRDQTRAYIRDKMIEKGWTRKEAVEFLEDMWAWETMNPKNYYYEEDPD